MPRAAAAIPLLDACARVEMIAAADTACHQPRRGRGGPPDNLGSAGDGAGAEHGANAHLPVIAAQTSPELCPEPEGHSQRHTRDGLQVPWRVLITAPVDQSNQQAVAVF